MFRRVFIRASLMLAIAIVSASSVQAATYQFDDWQYTPSAGTEYMVDIYGVIPPTPSKPYMTWVLIHDNWPYDYAGYVPEYGYYKWHLSVGANSPGIVAAYGFVYRRENGGAWQSVGQISGVLVP